MCLHMCRSHLGMSICGIAWECQFEVTLGMSICVHAQECLTETCIPYLRMSMELEDGVGGGFLAMEDREDSVAGPSQHTYLA